MHRDEADDPYVSLDGQQEDEAEEREELEILPTDSLLVVARTEDALSQLDVYVYDDSQENLYIHHDLLLPAMPLCLEWLDFTPAPGEDNTRRQLGQAGNFIAVGTLDPEIEIWSLDIIDGLYPDAILGRSAADRAAAEAIVAPPPANGRKKPKRPKKPKPAKSDQFHIDSILSLSWNRTHRSLLASASADTTVKLWDLNRPGSAGALRSFDTHTDKVQAVEWNPAEPTVLASGGWDKVLRVYDSRNPGNTVGARVDSDLECLRWHSWSPAEILVSLESGLVQAFDTRKMSASLDAPAALWTLAAHDGSASTVDYSPLIPGFLVTGGVDGNVKLWSVDSTSASTKVSLVASRDLSVVRPSAMLSDALRAKSSRRPAVRTTLRPSPWRARRAACSCGTHQPTLACARPLGTGCVLWASIRPVDARTAVSLDCSTTARDRSRSPSRRIEAVVQF